MKEEGINKAKEGSNNNNHLVEVEELVEVNSSTEVKMVVTAPGNKIVSLFRSFNMASAIYLGRVVIPSRKIFEIFGSFTVVVEYYIG